MENVEPVTQKFVTAMIERVKVDTACRAALRRADNTATESRAWEYILPFCRLEVINERKAFCLIGAAIARAVPEHDGHMSIGSALRSLCKGNKKDNGNKEKDDDLSTELARLRRLLACNAPSELPRLIRHVLRYLQTKDAPVSYSQTLRDILYWNENTRIRWTKDFFKARETDQKE